MSGVQKKTAEDLETWKIKRSNVSQKVERWAGRYWHSAVTERNKQDGAEVLSLPLIRLILKSLVASPLQASLTHPWLALLLRQRLKSTKGMEICFNPRPSKVTLMLQ